MKKLFAISILMAMTMYGFAQQNHYDFSVVVESGQTLYFLKGWFEDPLKVMVTYPCQDGTNTYYYGY